MEGVFHVLVLVLGVIDEAVKWRRERDSNPRYKLPCIPTFQAGAFSHSATSPYFTYLLPCNPAFGIIRPSGPHGACVENTPAAESRSLQLLGAVGLSMNQLVRPECISVMETEPHCPLIRSL